MNEAFRLSKQGADLIKAFEGCLRRSGKVFKPYRCPAGVLTIGWGHTNDHGRPFNEGASWSQATCDAAFLEDMVGFEDAVKRLVRVQLNQHQFDALVSFAYNCGEGNLSKSTLLKKVNRGDFDGAAREFGKWNRGGGRVLAGLVRRRASEALLFQGVPDRDYDGKPDRNAEPMAQQVDAPEPPKTIVESKSAWTSTAIGTGAAAAAANEGSTIVESLKEGKDTADSLGLTDHIIDFIGRAVHSPVMWLFVIMVCGAAFLIYDRRKKLREEQV